MNIVITIITMFRRQVGRLLTANGKHNIATSFRSNISYKMPVYVSKDPTDPCLIAAKNNDLVALKNTYNKDISMSWLIPINAAKNGNLEMLKFCHENGCEIKSFVAENAAYYGHLDILKYLIENNCEWNRYNSLFEAAKGGHVNVLEYIMELHQPLSKRYCYLCLDAHNIGCCVANIAANNGHLKALRWAHENTYCDYFMERYDLCAAAAENGHLNILQWLVHNGYNWNKNTCIKAAKAGHLRILRWATRNGCPLDIDACKTAAKEYPHILRWLNKQTIY